MRRFTQPAVMLLTLLAVSPAAWADRTYQFLNNADLQGGWSLSGNIVTDGTLGTLQASNILSWIWTISNGVSSYTLSSGNLGASSITGGITATDAGLFLPNL